MARQRFVLGWQPQPRAEGFRVDPFLQRFLSNRIKTVLGDHQGMGNYMTYRDAIRILGMDPAEIYKDGRIHLDPNEWADLGWLCLHMGPPESAVQAMREATTAEFVGPYSPDLIAPLREAAAQKFGRERGDDFEVIGTEGAQAGIGYAMLTCIDPGDEVIITDPGYFHFAAAIHLAGGVPVRVPLRPQNGYRLDPDEVARHLTLRTRMIVICDPVNPFGTVQTREELLAIGRLARKHGILVLNDITHNCHRIDPAAEQIPMAALYGEMETDHIISTFGLSHGYGMAGVRLGFLAGHPDLMRACLYTKVGMTRLNTNIVAQFGALAALQDKSYLAECEALIRRNYAHVRETVAAIPGLSLMTEPRCGIAVTIDVSGAGVTGQELTVSLFKRRVAVYPADGLGDYRAADYLRINLSRPDLWAYEQFRAALPDAIAEARSGLYREQVIEFFTRSGTERGHRVARAIRERAGRTGG